jgi:predicted transposase/invertase (TIGR01784 family)
MALSDWTSGINYAREEGIKEVARKIKSRGRSFEEIAEDTGLSLEEVAKL